MPDTPDSRPDPGLTAGLAAPPTTILAFDYGGRRIGIAAGQSVTGSASPLTTVANRERGPDWPAIERLIEEWRPSRLVVGLPVTADGSESEAGRAARDFGEALRRFGLPVDVTDERYSSLEARERLVEERRAGLRGRLRRETIDAAAAVVIAERWLRRSAGK